MTCRHITCDICKEIYFKGGVKNPQCRRFFPSLFVAQNGVEKMPLCSFVPCVYLVFHSISLFFVISFHVVEFCTCVCTVHTGKTLATSKMERSSKAHNRTCVGGYAHKCPQLLFDTLALLIFCADFCPVVYHILKNRVLSSPVVHCKKG
jgi:hypothetical protein